MAKAEAVSKAKMADKEEMAATNTGAECFWYREDKKKSVFEHLKRSVDLSPTKGRIEAYDRIRQELT